MKDLFSDRSDSYARFRPGYPAEFIRKIIGHCIRKKVAWDPGTGSGQLASVLSEYFSTVYASDLSRNQIEHAIPKDNIHYFVADCTYSTLPDESVDLITVAQAAHWFPLNKFYAEAKRILKPGGIIAIIGYSTIRCSNIKADQLLQDFYNVTTGPYWDPERRHLDLHYSDIDFPFQEIAIPESYMQYKWTKEQLLGYLSSWSAVSHFIRKENRSPIPDLEKALDSLNINVYEVRFPLFARCGRK